jgi:hypothetical protein
MLMHSVASTMALPELKHVKGLSKTLTGGSTRTHTLTTATASALVVSFTQPARECSQRRSRILQREQSESVARMRFMLEYKVHALHASAGARRPADASDMLSQLFEYS